jgi:alkylation response protein AidB-like acyl-CoA dehydrogenase
MAACTHSPLTDEAAALEVLLPEVARYVARHVDGYAIDREGEIPAAVRAGLGSLGLFGLTVPEVYGGAGLSLGSACRVIEQIARVDRSVAIMVGLHVGLGTRGLVEHGAPVMRARWLPRIAAGDCIASFAATEAGAGSDLTAIRTTGRLVDGRLRIDGEKSYVTNGGFAGLFTVLARTPGMGGERAHSLVCIPAETPGVTIGKEEDKLGIRGSSTVTVGFDGVVVPTDHILGAPGAGMPLAYGLLGWGRTLMSAGCVGTARGALRAALEHVSSRRQFGKAIGDFAATRAQVAWIAARVHAMEALVLDVAGAHAGGAATENDSAIAKVFCSESAFEACDRALQLHGALGFLEATGVARMLRDCRITRIFEGANDVLLVRVGAALLAAPAGATNPLSTAAPPGVRGLADRLRGLEVALRTEAVALRERLGVGAIRRQLVLQALARAAIALRAARASLGRTEDLALACFAAEGLADEAAHWLGELSRAERTETRVKDLTDRLYGQAPGDCLIRSVQRPRAQAP